MLPAFPHSRLAVNSAVSGQHSLRSTMLPSSPRRHGGHALLLAALIISAQAQDGDVAGSSGQEQQVSTAMVALLAAVVAVFVFIAASTVYLRHCSGYATSSPPPAAGDDRRAGSLDSAFFASRSWWLRRRRGGRGSPRGLDAEVVEAFPTMTYAEAKALRVGMAKGGEEISLECAVCLSEFEDGDRLRLLLPKCSHAFHPDCIAQWLAGHVTCPVCRCNLQPSDDKDDTSASVGEPTIPLASSISSDTAAALQDAGVQLPVAVVIDVVTEEEEEEEERRQEALELQRIGSQRRAVSGRRPAAAELARWHSTGGCDTLAARLDRDLERFTLRLPEHVRREMVAAAAERSSRQRRGRRRRDGEGGGSGGACSEPLVGRLGSRWQSLLGGTTFSGRLSFFSASRVTVGSGGGEMSSSSSYYTRLRGKRVAAVDVADEVPAEGSVRLDSIGGRGEAGGKASREVAAAAADEEKGVEKQGRT